MKIKKMGRERPVLYRDRFSVPLTIIKRLAASKNHFVLAQITKFNGEIDQYYLVIDNLLSAIIIAKRGALTTTNHLKKISEFFKYMEKRAKIRSIEMSDFFGFYKLWLRSRYTLYFPKSSEIEKIRLFSMHLLEFANTEIARLFKSDETILAEKTDELLEIYQSEAILEEAEHIHEYHQIEAERIGDMYGSKLGMKLANRWNFIDVSLLADRAEIRDIVDQSEEIRELLIATLKNWDEIISRVQSLMLKRIALQITSSKMKKKAVNIDVAMKEAIEAAARHPKTHNFRLTLNIMCDFNEPRKTASSFSRLMKASRDMIEHPHRPVMTGWEIYKRYS